MAARITVKKVFLNAAFGKAVHEATQHQTYKEASEQSGVPVATLHRVICGNNVSPTIETFLTLCAYCGLEPEKFIK